MKKLVVVLGAWALAGCGGEEAAPVAQSDCSLPDCEAIESLGTVGRPLHAVGTDALLGFRGGKGEKGDLFFHPIGSKAQAVASGVFAETVAVDPAGDVVLYLEPTGTAPTVRGEPVGVLQRWNVHSGATTQVLGDARGAAFGVCGDWLWSWHGGGTFANCAWMSAQQISTGKWVGLGDSCDGWSVERLAWFSRDCGSLVTAPGTEQVGVGVTHLASGAQQIVGAGTGSFLASPRLDRVVAPDGASGQLLLADLLTGTERSLTEGWVSGQPWRFSPSGYALIYQVQDAEDGNHLLLLRDGGEPVELSQGFAFVEAVGFSPNERAVAWVERSLADGRRHLWLQDTESGVRVEVDGDAFAGNDSSIAPVVDDGGAFVAWIDRDGSLRLADLARDTSWQVATGVDSFLFVGERLVWSDGTAGHVVPLPRS
ncbi:TolB family protein [Vulgatibacter sp.]|uniref:TolB family protein n=1 Tax=Vulgatibacter sp. TaxID=1971226 RepID=UPI0035665B6D